MFSYTFDAIQWLLDVLDTFCHINGLTSNYIDKAKMRQYNQDTSTLQGRANPCGAKLQMSKLEYYIEYLLAPNVDVNVKIRILH